MSEHSAPSKLQDLEKALATPDNSELPSTTDSASPSVEANPDPGRAISGFRWALVVFSLLIGIFLFSLDNTVVADLIPILVNEFEHVEQLPWLSVGFTIGAVILVLTFGKAYAILDSKWLFVGSSILFQAASVLCGAAPTVEAEIVGRVLAGIGGNGMYTGTLTLLITYTTAVERGGYLAAIGIVWGLGTVLGPVVGGGFAEVDWRWAFYINPMIGVFCILICILCIPATDPAPGTPYGKRLASFDYVGSVLFTGAVTFLVMGINLGGSQYLWSNARIIAFFVVAGVMFIAFFIQQAFSILVSPEERIFPVTFLKNRNAILLYICASASNVAAFIPIYYIPIYFQFTKGDTALDSAVRLLPLIFILSATIFITGQIIVRWGSFQDFYIAGFVLALVGSVLMSRIDEGTSISAIYGYEVLIALGTGCLVQAGYTVIYLFIAPSDGANAVSFMSLAQLGGMALGLSIAGSVFVNKAVSNLAPVIPEFTRSQLVQAVSGSGSAILKTLPEEVRQEAIHAIIFALRQVFILAYVACALGLVCSPLITRKNIGKVMKGLQAAG
ncbi:major facilitator superfamily domain-containing protein [Bisporella sp. PMI_857]|nr:major facilitator superfamily domain-containing protein [Bisporella sp. PMI_857]